MMKDKKAPKLTLALVTASLGCGGAERVLSILANQWQKQGHKISIIILASSAEKPFYSLHPSIELVSIGQVDTEKLSFFERGKRIFCRLQRLRKALKSARPDVVISFIDIVNMMTLISTLGLKLKIVVSERIDPKYHKIPLFYKFLRTITYHGASSIVVQTKSAARYFSLPTLAKKVLIIPNAAEKHPLTIKYAVKPKVQNLVAVGRLNRQKDYPTLFYAFAKILPYFPALTLTIYGEGPERKKLEEIIKRLNLKDKILLPGLTTTIFQKLTKADLFVFPSLYEGFPNALCEAMTIGLPVVASDCSGNVDIVQDHFNGRLFPKGDQAALAAIIKEMADDYNQRVSLSRNAQKITEQFNPERISQLWNNLVNTLQRE
jgi:glycosyltransferase involved in cell wall biosynthesis